ncbi:MAG: class I SAM-dependent methyltransferase [Chloroflexi bacterium]|nr:class I SAM-dependent methyltransferase [Chloroflexota bacterium]
MAKWRKRAFAWCYHHLLSRQGEPDFSDPFTREVRAPLLAQARGDVLEIGAGTGGNLPFYPPGVRLTLLEPNPYMIRYLDGNCTAHAADCAAIVEGIGERLPFPANSFDTVLTTHVLCSVRDQSEVLAEVRRVLRPGGRFLFIEHVAAQPGTLNHRAQHAINPVWQWVGDGCHLTRDTGAAIRAAGFEHVEIRPYNVRVWPPLASPPVFGSAMVGQ